MKGGAMNDKDLRKAVGFMVVGSRDDHAEHITLLGPLGRRQAVELAVELEDLGFTVEVYGFRGGEVEIVWST
jgi:hypothetical protein